MMEALETRGRAVATRAAAGNAERLAAAARDLPGIAAEASGERVTLEGRGLARRAMTEPALRWPAELLR